MRNFFLPILLIFASLVSCNAQDFVTRWQLPTGTSFISFGCSRVGGAVSYTWQQLPAGASGSGSLAAGISVVTITGLPSGSTIRLSLSPTNLKAFKIGGSSAREYLLDVEKWGTSKWSDMAYAFNECYNLNITATDIPNLDSVTKCNSMFQNCFNLNGPTNIDSWNTSNVIDMHQMFQNAKKFNQSIGNWNTSKVTDMSEMFSFAVDFNQPINNWITSNVTNMSYMFYSARAFNQPIGNWNTSKVTDMSHLFQSAKKFNQPIGNWNTENVTNMAAMFYDDSAFNQPIGNWNTENVINMNYMLGSTQHFNQPIGNWNTEKVVNMDHLFYNAKSFNQDLGTWRLDSLKFPFGMLDSCGLSCINYANTLKGWNTNPSTPNNLNFSAAGLLYGSNAVAARDSLKNIKRWFILGDILGSCDITTGITDSRNNLDISIYPNPTHHLLNIDMKNIAGEKIIQLFNINGEIILQQKSSTNSDFIQLDVSYLPKANYFLQIKTEKNKIQSFPFLVQ